MPDTIQIPLPAGEWTQINSGPVGTVSNFGERDVRLHESVSQPSDTLIGGHVLRPSSHVPFSLTENFNLWARPKPADANANTNVFVSVSIDPIMDTVLRDKFLAAFETSEEGTTALGVFVQDQTTPNVNLAFHRNLQTVTLASNTVLDSHTATFETGHGFVNGATPAHSLCLQEVQNFTQLNVLGVAGDVVTFDSPFDHIYTPAANAIRHTFDMRFIGSPGSPGTYIIKPIDGQKWDITRVIFIIESTANNMDFTKFGSINPITNGCVFRKKDGDRQNIFNWKTNGDLINRSFDHIFQEKTGGGGSGFVARITFAGQNKQGIAIRLDGSLGEELQVLIQDDLTAAALTKIFMIAQGHLVQD